VPSGPDAFIVSFADEARASAFGIAQDLRAAGLAADLDLAGRSPKGQLKQAGRSGASVAVLVGLDELGPGRVRLRAMDGGGEEDVAAAGLASLLRVRLGKES